MKVRYTKDIHDPVYQDALSIREEVFIAEQGVPRQREIDQDEGNTIHFVLYDDTDKPQATVRLLAAENKMKVQRMAVLKPARKSGYGRILMSKAEDYARKHHFTQLVLGAQMTARDFYQRLGYHSQGDIFIDAGMEHILMVKDI